MPKNKDIKKKYDWICNALRHDPQELEWFNKDFATSSKDLLEALVCDAMGWQWIWEDNSGWDAVGDVHKELKANCYTGNAKEGKGKIEAGARAGAGASASPPAAAAASIEFPAPTRALLDEASDSSVSCGAR